MRNIDAALLTHIQGEVTTLATLWKVTRKDATVMGFTNHDVDLVVGGVTYLAATGFMPSEVAIKSDYSVGNQEIDSILDSSVIDYDDLLNGIYDYAEVVVYLINYKSLTDTPLIISKGWLGQFTLLDGQFTAEVRSLTEKLNKQIGEVYSPSCRAVLGDGRCKLNLASFTLTNKTVDITYGKQQFYATDLLSQSAGFFTSGEIEWVTGDNAGLKMEVKELLQGVVYLSLPMAKPIQTTDTYNIVAGCDKDFTTCKDKFNNVNNFRGEPHVPGSGKMLETAGTFSS